MAAVAIPRRPKIREIGEVCATCKRYDWDRVYCMAHQKLIGRGPAQRTKGCQHYIQCPTCK